MSSSHSDGSLSLSLSLSLQRVAVARDEGLKAGLREAQEARPTDSTPSSVSEEEVGRRVKNIMSHTYQTMAVKLKKKPQFEGSEVLSILLATIKVGVAYVGVVMFSSGCGL